MKVASFLWEALLNATTNKRCVSKIKVNDFVRWVPDGIEQWSAPRKVTHFVEYDSKLFVMVEGSLTGIPLEQVIKT